MIKRRKTRTVNLGAVKIGGAHPVSIQSMTKTDTADVAATVRQIKELEQAGCEIVRLAVKNRQSALALDKIKARIAIPLVADIHFNYRLALEAVSRGVDGIRLNPGNIYRRDEVKQIAIACRKRRIPIRVGVNAGSLVKKPVLRLRSGLVVSEVELPETRVQKPEKIADLMVTSAINCTKLLESFDFHDIIVSLKASSVETTVSAYRKIASLCAYPLHLGITACGLPQDGMIKTAIGIGSLLLDGIGDTVRVSLTASPVEEVKVAQEILQALSLRQFRPEIIACPTCGRTQVDIAKIATEVKAKLSAFSFQLSANRPLTIAIMGCEVNGPGEARDADIGVACGKNCALLFRKGKIVKKINPSTTLRIDSERSRTIKAQQIADVLIKELSED